MSEWVVLLAGCFEAIANAASLAHRLDSLIALIEWVQQGPTDADARPDRSRLIKAIEVLEALPDVRRGLQDTFAEILSETEGVNLFGETGIPGDRGFIAELTDRVMGRVLPEPNDDHDLARLVSRLYASRAKAESFHVLAPELFDRIVRALAPADRPEIWAPLTTAFARSSSRVARQPRRNSATPSTWMSTDSPPTAGTSIDSR